MARSTRRIAALALLTFALSGCASLKTTGSLVVSGHSIAFAHSGHGDPPIVLQSGLGDDRTPWTELFQELQSRHTVLTYDRPGYGASNLASGPRDPCTIATEARSVLLAAGLKPPFVLVGHSLGGLYQYVFARLYPEDVVGLVLLDPTHPLHWQTMQREAPVAASALLAVRASLFGAAARREFDQQADCVNQFDATPFRRVPTRILVSTRASAIEGADYQGMLVRLRGDWLRLTGATSLDAVPGAGHYLQRDAPDKVKRAIEDVVSNRASR
jgi:pimeloyl-ACP methyl ester carboxylesterase